MALYVGTHKASWNRRDLGTGMTRITEAVWGGGGGAGCSEQGPKKRMVSSGLAKL